MRPSEQMASLGFAVKDCFAVKGCFDVEGCFAVEGCFGDCRTAAV